MPGKSRNSSVDKPDADSGSFPSILQGDVPKGREGKHKRIVMRLLNDIAHLKPGTALKVPLSALPDSKENIRSALNRATRQRGVEVSTSSDAEHLYIWKVTQKP
jgi:TusA-related sulfurtransferase